MPCPIGVGCYSVMNKYSGGYNTKVQDLSQAGGVHRDSDGTLRVQPPLVLRKNVYALKARSFECGIM